MDEQTKQALALVGQPVFFAEDGKIVWRNAAAAALIAEGTAVTALLDKQLLAMWPQEDVLRFSLPLAGADYLVSVRTLQNGLLFVAERTQARRNSTDLLESAAVHLRQPVHDLFSAAQTALELLPESEAAEAAAADLNQSAYRLLRYCGQLSEGGRALHHALTARRVLVEAMHFFEMLAGEIAPLLAAAGLHLNYRGLDSPCRLWMDGALVERAVYNLIANAARYTPKNGTLCLTVERLQSIIAIKLSDNGAGVSPQMLARLFAPEAEPEVGDPRWGLRLGLTLVREIARLHGGSLILAGNGAEAGTTAVFSLSLEPARQELRSPGLQYDYTSGCHHGLVELSELLPAELYTPKSIS